MAEKLYPGSTPRLDEYEFRDIFPHQTPADIVAVQRDIVIDAGQFEFFPKLYANRISPKSQAQMADHLARVDGKTVGEIFTEGETAYSEFCVGDPTSNEEQRAVFATDLGPAVSATDHGPHTADALLDWQRANRKNSSLDKVTRIHQRDLFVLAGLFHNTLDAIIGAPRANYCSDVSNQLKASLLRELLYKTFDDHEQEIKLIASTLYTGDSDIDSRAHSHEQILIATGLDTIKTGARAANAAPLRAAQGHHEQASRYQDMATIIAHFAVPEVVMYSDAYPAINLYLSTEPVASYVETRAH